MDQASGYTLQEMLVIIINILVSNSPSYFIPLMPNDEIRVSNQAGYHYAEPVNCECQTQAS